MNKVIRVAVDFTDTPGARYRADGPFSGQEFREDYVVPALNNESRLEIDLDDVEGFGSSFLEEAFGGLVRENHFTENFLREHMTIKSVDMAYIDQIWRYITEASKVSSSRN